MTSKATIRQAIKDIEECKRIHVDWADWLESAPPEKRRASEPVEDVAGDAGHHRKWARRYDRVLRILRDAEGLLS